MEHGHARVDERSLVLHRLALGKFKADPTGAKRKVLEVLDRWCSMPHLRRQAPLLDKWRGLLDLPVEDLKARVLGESSQQLRQCSPLGVLISPQERFAVYRELQQT